MEVAALRAVFVRLELPALAAAAQGTDSARHARRVSLFVAKFSYLNGGWGCSVQAVA
jgi:hypothetical protein